MCVPVDIAALTFPEQLVLWSMRNWLAGGCRRKLIARELCQACGCAAGRIALTSLDAALMLLTRHAVRPICCLPLPRREISPDEAAVLSLVAASQAKDWWHVDAQSRVFVAPESVGPLRESVAQLGTALEFGARILPPRYALPAAGDVIH